MYAPGPPDHHYIPGQPRQVSAAEARNAYPTFLSLPETLKLQVIWAWRGLLDANRWDFVISTVYGYVGPSDCHKSSPISVVRQGCRNSFQFPQVVYAQCTRAFVYIRLRSIVASTCARSTEMAPSQCWMVLPRPLVIPCRWHITVS